MRKVEKAMVDAISTTLSDPGVEGPTFKGGNTVVFQTSTDSPNGYRTLEVIFYDTVICLIEPTTRFSLYTGGFKTATTKSRLNAILDAISDGFYIAQDKGTWGIYKGGYFYRPFVEGCTFTLRP